jgi:hypothetical protein
MAQNNQEITIKTISDIIKKVCSEQPKTAQLEDVVIIIDRSGSTGDIFIRYTNSNTNTNINVLQKELQVAEDYILSNHANYSMCAFDHTVTPIIQIKPNYLEQIVQMPTYTQGGSTLTHLAFKAVNQMIRRPERVILITDGQTNSTLKELKDEIDIFNKEITNTDSINSINSTNSTNSINSTNSTNSITNSGNKIKKIRLDVIAVSANKIDMNTISSSEEMRIPGMDLIGYLGNAIKSLTIYNQFHLDVPFVGALSSEIDKSKIQFMGGIIQISIPQFINKLIEEIEEIQTNKQNNIQINWGTKFIEFKKMVSEIGKLLTVFFVDFPESNPFVEKICKKLHISSNILDMTEERIKNLLFYGFDATKQEIPIKLTNVEQNSKTNADKHKEFADAVNQLDRIGSTCGSSDTIAIGSNGLVIINKENTLEINKNLKYVYFDSKTKRNVEINYPNSIDKYDNMHFSTNPVYAQATRIALRTFCGTIGFADFKTSSVVIFYVLNQMLLMYLSDKSVHSMDSTHMKQLQQLAIIQTSMDIMINDNSRKCLYVMLKNGELPRMYWKNPQTHTSLYLDKLINPLGFSEPIWWACMMTMLGLFNQQIRVYRQALQAIESLGTNPLDENTFLEYSCSWTN